MINLARTFYNILRISHRDCKPIARMLFSLQYKTDQNQAVDQLIALSNSISSATETNKHMYVKKYIELIHCWSIDLKYLTISSNWVMFFQFKFTTSTWPRQLFRKRWHTAKKQIQ